MRIFSVNIRDISSGLSQVAIRTRISIGWLFGRNFPKNSLLFSAVVFLPLYAYIDTNHSDVGGDAHFM
jgi:hypothetical protein